MNSFIRTSRTCTLYFLGVFFACVFVSLSNAQEPLKKDRFPMELNPYIYSSPWSGKKSDTLFPSKVLGYKKNVTIFTPAKYASFPEEKHPLILIFDRQDKQLTDYLLSSISMLDSYGQIPGSVVVAIESGGAPGLRRMEAKWGVDGPNVHGEKYDEFIFDELLPYVKENYSIDNNQVIVYGHSWFGYHSTMMLINHIPDLFAIISASPCCLKADGIEDIVGAISDAGYLNRKFYYRVASGHDIGDDLDVYRELTGKITTLRKPQMFDYKTTWYSAAMHMEVPGLHLFHSLYEIYADWADLGFAYADPANCPTFNDARLYDSLQVLSDNMYGFRIPITRRHIDMRVEYYRYIQDKQVSNKGKIATWMFMISKYGESTKLNFNIAETYQLLNKSDSASYYLNKAKKLDVEGEWKERINKLKRSIHQ